MAVLRRFSRTESTSSLSSPPPSSSSDSELSELSASPSPPSSPALAHRLLGFNSRPSSQTTSTTTSTRSSPAPARMRPTPPVSDSDGPARKKRKLEPKERTTERVDLTQDGAENDPHLQRVMDVLQKKRKIVVIAGAGISVSAGIPDFRSSAGLFSSLKKEHKLKSSGKDLFDASVYQDDSSTSSFHDMVRNLSQQTKQAKPTPFHHLLATLAKEGRLLRLYSQNVDGIDTSLPPLKTEVPFPKKGPYPKTVQLHGGLGHMVCSKCHTLSDFNAEIFNGPEPPACPQCVENDQIRAVAEKRSHGIGRLRPRMVLYNEHNPDDEAIGSCASQDLRARPDAVIVAGTTLKVPGVRRIAREMCKMVRDRRDGVTVWINNDPEPVGKDLENSWDIVVKGPCDEVARHAAMPKWDDPTTWKEATDDEVDKAKKSQKPAVIVPQTPKKLAHTALQMLTPAASPRMDPISVSQRAQSTPSKPGRKRKSEGAVEKTVKRQPAKKRAPKKKTKSAVQTQAQTMTSIFTVSKSRVQTSAVGKKETVFINSTSNPADQNKKMVQKGEMGQSGATAAQKLTPAIKPEPSTPRIGRLTKLKPHPRPSMVDLDDSDPRVNRSGSPTKPEMEPFTSPPSSPRFFTPPSFLENSQYDTPDNGRPGTADSQTSDMIIPSNVPRGLGSLIHQ